MMHNNLLNYYERLFAFRQFHNWSITEIENLLPWELDVMTTLYTNYIETKKMQQVQDQLNSQVYR